MTPRAERARPSGYSEGSLRHGTDKASLSVAPDNSPPYPGGEPQCGVPGTQDRQLKLRSRGDRVVAVMEQPDSNDEFNGVDFQCPKCGATLDRYQPSCPHCGSDLEGEFSATYRPAASPVAKTVALVILVGGILIPLVALLVYVLS